MEQQQKAMSLDEFINRKVKPVKMIVAHLNREFELTNEAQVSFSRSDIDNIITTLEIFVEEYERVTSVRSPRMQSRGHDAGVMNKKPAIRAVA